MKCQVLLVDDEPQVTRSLRLGLRNEPYEVATASSGHEALALLAGRPVDVVVSDERMVGMQGSELLARVRQLYPSTVRIILTGQASLAAAVRAINEGEIYRFLQKPCSADELRVTIRQSLEHLELMRTARRLLQTNRRQTRVLAGLEETMLGITQVKRDESGAVVIEDDGEQHDAEALMKEAMESIEQAESVLKRVRPKSI